MDDRRKVSLNHTSFSHRVGTKEMRKLRSQRGKFRSIWFGLGMLGLIGWSVVVPTLVGIALGIWIDNHHPSQYSWTLMLLIIGLSAGCLNVWRWIAHEHREIRKEQEEEKQNPHDHT